MFLMKYLMNLGEIIIPIVFIDNQILSNAPIPQIIELEIDILRLLAGGKTAAYSSYVRILTPR